MSNNRVLPPHIGLPMGFVNMDKSGRDVAVGIVGADRMPALGFDVTGPAPNHWRVVPYGNFGAFIGTRYPVEVRVLMDGELLLETELIPNEQPGAKKSSKLDPKVRAMMLENPQAFQLNIDGQGKPFNFAAHPSTLSKAQIIDEQIHPGLGGSPPTMDMLHNSAPVRDELRVDFTREDLAAKLPSLFADNPEQLLPRELQSSTPETSAQCPSSPDPSLMDPYKRSITWAPSHGLVAVGVRMMQQLQEGEPPTAPDGFSYVLFQLNPFELHSLARTKLMRRVVMPSMKALHEMAKQEGFGHECPPPVGACGCVHLGEPTNRQKKRR